MTNEAATSSRHYPVRCPHCGDIEGYPRSVQTVRSKPGYIRIDVCCHSCNQRWFEEVETDRR